MKKLLNKKGFTLMEMLIVVAIIVILAAISIPTFSGSLDSAKVATDEANLRAAKSAAVSSYMLAATDADKPAAGDVYNIESGEFETLTAIPETDKDDYYGASKANEKQVIVFTLDANNNPGVKWDKAPGAK